MRLRCGVWMLVGRGGRVESIRQWPVQEEIARMVAANGWDEVEYRNLTGGIACMHLAVKPLP